MTYDSNGNTTAVSGDTYGYDAANRLTSASAGAGASAFTFDPMNRLATSTVGGASTRRQYVGQQLVAEYNVGTGALTRRYIPGLGLDDVAAAYDGSGTSNRSWQLADERGSVIAQSGATGAVSNINTYDEYGVPASGNVGRFQYTGQQWLPEAGAYHYRARTYLPQVGRFLQTDPIGYAAGANLYAYVGGDPVNRIDPMGLEFKDPKWTNKAECEREGWEVVRRSDGLWCTPKTATGGPTVGIGDQGSWTKPNSAGGGGGSLGAMVNRNTCPAGYLRASIGGSAGAFLGPIGQFFGAGFEVSIGITEGGHFTPRGSQISLFAQNTRMIGAGGYVGAGIDGGLGYSSTPFNSGGSTELSNVAAFGAGLEASAGTSASWDESGGGLSTGVPDIGAGWGLFGGYGDVNGSRAYDGLPRMGQATYRAATGQLAPC